MKTIKLSDDFYWVGVLNKNLRVFDIIITTEYGTSFNSYLLETTDGWVVFENVKVFKEDDKYPSVKLYIEKLKSVVGDLTKIKYMVLNHTEPDHTGSAADLIKHFNKDCKVVCTPVAADYLKEILNTDFDFITVKEGDEIKVGNKTLQFFDIPMLHWPDSMFTLIKENKIAVTCDVLGAHYCYPEMKVSEMPEKQKNAEYKQAIMDYYLNIMSPFKPFVLNAMAKLQTLLDDKKLDMVATGHGPLIDEKQTIQECIATYRNHSTIKNPFKKKTIVFVECSAYGYTHEIGAVLRAEMKKHAEYDFKVYDINVENYENLKANIAHDILFSDAFLLGVPTINNDANGLVWDLLTQFTPIEIGQKPAAVYGSYGWSGEAVKNLTQRLTQLRMKVTKGLLIRFRLKKEEVPRIEEFAHKFMEFVKTKKADPEFLYKNITLRETIWK